MSEEKKLEKSFQQNLSEGIQPTDLNKLFGDEMQINNKELFEKGLNASSQNPLLNFDITDSSQSSEGTSSDCNSETNTDQKVQE